MNSKTFYALFYKILTTDLLSNEGKIKTLQSLDAIRWQESKNHPFTEKDTETLGTYSTLINNVHINSYEDICK